MKPSRLASANRQSNNTKKAASSLHWRRSVIRELAQKGFTAASENLHNCCTSFFVKVCTKDIQHEPKAIPKHCGLRICDVCSHRESYRKILRYLPALNEMAFPNPDLPDYRLRKVVLTTPWTLKELTSDSFKHRQALVAQFFQLFFYPHFEKRKALSKAEIRSGRVNLAQHHIGGIVAAEFGEGTQHLHWHILCYTPYMDKKKIWEVWEQVTGGTCRNVDVSEIKPQSAQMRGGGGDLLAAIKEIVKYATKFTAIEPRDVPHLHEVLKGNRRFRSFGTLYNIKDGNDVYTNICATCGGEIQLISPTTYVARCEFHKIAPDDSVLEPIESGIEHYLYLEPEISPGKSPKKQHRARDSLPEEG